MPTQNVAVGAQFAVLRHNQNDINIPIFVTPNWNTAVFDSTPDRTNDSATVYFTSDAHGTEPKIIWKTVYLVIPSAESQVGIVAATGTVVGQAVLIADWTSNAKAIGATELHTMVTAHGVRISKAVATASGQAGAHAIAFGGGVSPAQGAAACSAAVTTRGVTIKKAVGTVSSQAGLSAQGTSITAGTGAITQLMPTGWPGRRYLGR